MLPEPVIVRHGRVLVLRDDLLPGGTKRRALGAMLSALGASEFVYASPAFGYAQIALAYAARDMGRRATVFVAARAALHPRTAEAQRAGARIEQVPHGYLSNVTAKARTYAADAGAALLPFGLDAEPFIESLANVARALPIAPAEFWTVAGSGVLTRALQRAWPSARAFAVRIGAHGDTGRATVLQAPEKYERVAALPPPFPSCPEYDAKAWRFIEEQASEGALFWNVGA